MITATEPRPEDTLEISHGDQTRCYVTRAAYDDVARRLDAANDALYRVLAASGIPPGIAWKPAQLADDIERWREAAGVADIPPAREAREFVDQALALVRRAYGQDAP